MAACTPFTHVFLGFPLFLLSSGIHSIINFGILSSTTVIKRMWQVNSKVIPVIIGTTGTISHLFGKYRRYRPEKTRNQGITQNSHIGHCTHTAASASVNVQNFQHNLLVTRCINKSNTQQLYALPTLYLCVV
jgi:hypothetical protein